MVVGVPAKSGTGPTTTLTSVDREGQASGGSSPADAAAATVRTADSVAGAAQLACVLEASAEKPGNITPSHDFHDTSYEDMLRSAIAVGPELARAGRRGVGETVLAVVTASRRVAPANTNLGIALLLAPLAKAALDGGPLRARLAATLRALDVADARATYTAIRRSGAGGLDDRVEHDVRSEPTLGLREAMASAAERDSVASEYVTDYALTFDTGVPALAAALGDGLALRAAIVDLHLRLLDQVPDTLIARKGGAETAARVSEGAREVLAAGGVRTAAGRRALRSFDASLRAPGNALNPGTTADLVTATLFVALVERML
jgi:triphosphoribosyl-dephospho-CoA synthase